MGEAFRLNAHRNGSGQHQHTLAWYPVAHWLVEFPAQFAVAILTGPQPQALRPTQLVPGTMPATIFPTHRPATRLPAGRSFTTTLQCPIAAVLGPTDWQFTLTDTADRIVSQKQVCVDAWPGELSLAPEDLPPGRDDLAIAAGDGSPLMWHTPFAWSANAVIEAEDPYLCRIEGLHRVVDLPRSIGLNPGFPTQECEYVTGS